MNFGQPHILYFLWLLPLIAWLLHVLYQRRTKIMSSFIQQDLLPQEQRLKHKRRYQIKSVLILTFIFFAIFAMARPQWGFREEEVRQQGLDILIAVDVSKSMLTQDVQPSRLERTKLAIKDLVKKLKGDRVGLIPFAGQAFLMCPLTSDYNGFLLSLQDLASDTIPRPGTNLSSAIEEAMKSFGTNRKGDKTLIVVTDGEDNEGEAIKTAQKAKNQKVRIYTVGIGTQEGELIKIKDENGNAAFLKDAEGNIVKSRLNESLLQQIAYVTGGAYVRSSGAQFGLDYIYERQLAGQTKNDFEQRTERKYYERYQWFLAIALLALLAETLVLTWRTS